MIRHWNTESFNSEFSVTLWPVGALSAVFTAITLITNITITKNTIKPRHDLQSSKSQTLDHHPARLRYIAFCPTLNSLNYHHRHHHQTHRNVLQLNLTVPNPILGRIQQQSNHIITDIVRNVSHPFTITTTIRGTYPTSTSSLHLPHTNYFPTNRNSLQCPVT